jgi:hypothetical protein
MPSWDQLEMSAVNSANVETVVAARARVAADNKAATRVTSEEENIVG